MQGNTGDPVKTNGSEVSFPYGVSQDGSLALSRWLDFVTCIPHGLRARWIQPCAEVRVTCLRIGSAQVILRIDRADHRDPATQERAIRINRLLPAHLSYLKSMLQVQARGVEDYSTLVPCEGGEMHLSGGTVSLSIGLVVMPLDVDGIFDILNFVSEPKDLVARSIRSQALLLKPLNMESVPLRPGDDTSKRLWTSRSWMRHQVAQNIPYADQEHLNSVCTRLSALPDLISSSEIDRLTEILCEVANGIGFIIQGGDCAEAFGDVRPDIVKSKTSLLSDQAAILSKALGWPVTCIGRIAGQYAKPRSLCLETLSCGTTVSAFRGDNINGPGKKDRSPDPERLLVGHCYAATTLSLMRLCERNESTFLQLGQSVFTSHEALNLHLEAALTRGAYNTSAHMVWIGERSRQIEGAHIEYIRGLRNPIGIKLGPTSTAEDVIQLLSLVDPDRTKGRVSLMTRLGAMNVSARLPDLINGVQKADFSPIWLCDPCHGNTFTTPTGIKSRYVETIIAEVKATHEVHAQNGSRLGGLHLEQTGEDVTECLDRVDEASGYFEFPRYQSLCDPRLSRSQALTVIRAYAAYVKDLDCKHEQVIKSIGWPQTLETLARIAPLTSDVQAMTRKSHIEPSSAARALMG